MAINNILSRSLLSSLLTTVMATQAAALVVPQSEKLEGPLLLPMTTEKQLVYCDHISGRINLYMDMHLDYNAVNDNYTNPEVAVFDATELTEFPKYPWAISVTFDPTTSTSLISMNKGQGNEIKFSIPSTTTGISLNKLNEAIRFNILAEGAYNGMALHSAPFTCYGAYNL